MSEKIFGTRLLLAVLCIGVFLPLQLVAQEKESEGPTADDILDRYLEALGGEMALAVEAIQVKGEFSGKVTGGAVGGTDMLGTSMTYYRDGVFVIEMEMTSFGGQHTRIGFDGKDYWRSSGEGEEPKIVTSESAGGTFSMMFLAQQALYWRDWDIEITKLDDTTFDDKDVYQLKFEADGPELEHYFDKESGLLIGTHLVQNQQDMTLRYEYEEIDGMNCIKKFELKARINDDMNLNYSYEFTEFDFDPEIPAGKFDRPDK